MASKKKAEKKEVPVTDVAREYFNENGVEMVKIKTLSGGKTIKEETMPSSEE